ERPRAGVGPPEGRSGLSTSTTGASSGHGGAAPALRLVRLDRDTDETRVLRGAVVRQRVAPDQRRFVTEAVHTLPRADTDPDLIPFAVVLVGCRPRSRTEALDTCAGFGIVDRRGHLRELVDTPERAALPARSCSTSSARTSRRPPGTGISTRSSAVTTRPSASCRCSRGAPRTTRC